MWVRAQLCKFATSSKKVYQLLAHGRWFSPASSTTKPGRHDIAEILLKVALKTQKIDQSDILLIEFEDAMGESESLHRSRRDNTMSKWTTKTNDELQNNIQETIDQVNMNPT